MFRISKYNVKKVDLRNLRPKSKIKYIENKGKSEVSAQDLPIDKPEGIFMKTGRAAINGAITYGPIIGTTLLVLGVIVGFCVEFRSLQIQIQLLKEASEKQNKELKEASEKQNKELKERMDLQCSAAVDRANSLSVDKIMKYNFSSEYKSTRDANINKDNWWSLWK